MELSSFIYPILLQHRCAEEVLTYLVNSLSQHTVSSLEFAALQETFNQLAEHVAQANTAALWSVLQVSC